MKHTTKNKWMKKIYNFMLFISMWSLSYTLFFVFFIIYVEVFPSFDFFDAIMLLLTLFPSVFISVFIFKGFIIK